MDLLMYFVIVVIFLVSLFSLMYMHSKFRVAKTFEEVQAEKKQFADKLYGSNHGKNQKKANRKVFNKKVRRSKREIFISSFLHKQKQKEKFILKKFHHSFLTQGKDKDRKQKDRKEQEIESQNESDGHSDSVSGESNNSPVHSSNKAHVEFSEAEVIAEEVTNTKVC